MSIPKVSVIIPVYKAEKYFAECINSVIGQDYSALEIILVDDGSPDSCPEMCDWYARTYGNIKTIHKNNEGVAKARNTGLEISAGQYIAFVDSDDCLDGAGAIRLMVEQAEEKHADIVIGLYRNLIGQQRGEINHHRLQDGAHTETADFRFKGFILSDYLISPCFKLYRRAFLTDNSLKFRDYPFREDHSFNMICHVYHPVYAFVDECVYLRRTDNGNSLSHQYWDNFIPVWIAIASDFELLLSERGIREEYNDLVAFYVCMGLYFLAKQELMYKGMLETVKALSRYGKHPLVREMAKALARGRYIDQIEGKAWKMMLWGASLLCSLHAYVLLALGIWVLQKVNADKRLRNLKSKS